MSMGWEYFSELWPPTGLLPIPQTTYEYGQARGRPYTSATVSTINPHRLSRVRTRVLALRGRRLSAWAMARPYSVDYRLAKFHSFQTSAVDGAEWVTSTAPAGKRTPTPRSLVTIVTESECPSECGLRGQHRCFAFRTFRQACRLLWAHWDSYLKQDTADFVHIVQTRNCNCPIIQLHTPVTQALERASLNDIRTKHSKEPG